MKRWFMLDRWTDRSGREMNAVRKALQSNGTPEGFRRAVYNFGTSDIGVVMIDADAWDWLPEGLQEFTEEEAKKRVEEMS